MSIQLQEFVKLKENLVVRKSEVLAIEGTDKGVKVITEAREFLIEADFKDVVMAIESNTAREASMKRLTTQFFGCDRDWETHEPQLLP